MVLVLCAKLLLWERMWKLGTLGTKYLQKKLLSGAQFCGIPLFLPPPAHSHGDQQTSSQLPE